MLNIRGQVTQLRKLNNLSQEELVKRPEVSRTIIGDYERYANTPSIEVLIKLAEFFNASVDYIIGEWQLSSLDKGVLKRIKELDTETKQHLFFLIDNVIQNSKTKKAFEL